MGYVYRWRTPYHRHDNLLPNVGGIVIIQAENYRSARLCHIQPVIGVVGLPGRLAGASGFADVHGRRGVGHVWPPPAR